MLLFLAFDFWTGDSREHRQVRASLDLFSHYKPLSFIQEVWYHTTTYRSCTDSCQRESDSCDYCNIPGMHLLRYQSTGCWLKRIEPHIKSSFTKLAFHACRPTITVCQESCYSKMDWWRYTWRHWICPWWTKSKIRQSNVGFISAPWWIRPLAEINYRTWEEYTAELSSGHLSWSPVHESEMFWKENATKFCDQDYAQLKCVSVLP